MRGARIPRTGFPRDAPRRVGEIAEGHPGRSTCRRLEALHGSIQAPEQSTPLGERMFCRESVAINLTWWLAGEIKLRRARYGLSELPRYRLFQVPPQVL